MGGHGSRRARLRAFGALVASVALGGWGLVAPSASAAAFQRGDVFLSSGAVNIAEYSPSGQLLATIPGTSAASGGCFDPSGEHLVVPGVGLFNSSGQLLRSKWGTDPAAGSCVADAFGNVYIAGAVSATDWTVTKYDISGKVTSTFDLAGGGGDPPVAIALAPDECTLYYGDWQDQLGLGRFNVCTGEQEPALSAFQFTDDLGVLPSGQILIASDESVALLDASGAPDGGFSPPPDQAAQWLRVVSPDPGGTSFWACCDLPPAPPFVPDQIFQFDLASGQVLAQWSTGSQGLLGVYGPPLLGNADVERYTDYNPPGLAEAFPETVANSGQLSSLDLYAASASTASQAVIGVYSDRHGQPGALQAKTTIGSLVAGSWNDVQIPTVSVSAGEHLWIAILGPAGGGTIRFRDDDGGGGPGSITSAQGKLTTLPATWSSGTRWPTTNLSAYGQ